MHHAFLAPSDEEVLEAIGEWPETDDSGARRLSWNDAGGGTLVFSYDALGRSVRVRWSNSEGDTVLDLYRESATGLTLSSTPSATVLRVDFHTGECAGALEIQVVPAFSVQDRLLFQ